VVAVRDRKLHNEVHGDMVPRMLERAIWTMTNMLDARADVASVYVTTSLSDDTEPGIVLLNVLQSVSTSRMTCDNRVMS
ncbi:hypothetical protein PENSPDRAFT_595548, partial [Peniophora sp. CONT]